MKTLLRDYSLWLVILLLQLLLTFGVYVVWSTEDALENNPTSRALEQNIVLKMQQISDSQARSLLEQQQAALQSHYLERGKINRIVQYLVFLSAGIAVLLFAAIVILVRKANDQQSRTEHPSDRS